MKAINKNIVREIKGSFSRFIAIFAIIALGVGFFSGLRVTRSAMLKTGDRYINEHALFDFRLLSTMGFDDDSIEYFTTSENVAYAEGTKNANAFFTIAEETDEKVAAIYSVPGWINTLSLTSGDMPSGDSECIGDARYFKEEDIGKTVEITFPQEEDDILSQHSFTLVGLCNSPLYLNFERGSASIGNGSVTCFIYVDDSAFSCDYYTGAYIKLSGTDGTFIYSDDYDNEIERCRSEIEQMCEDAAIARYKAVAANAEKQLSDAEEQYNKALDEYNTKKAEAEKELNDGEARLNNSEAELNRAKAEIEENGRLLNSSQQEIDSGNAEYAISLAAYNEGLSKYNESKALYDSGLSEYNRNLQSYQTIQDIIVAVSGSTGKLAVKKLTAVTDYMVEQGYITVEQEERILADAAEKADRLATLSQLIDELGVMTPVNSRLNEAKAQLDAAEIQLTSAKNELEASKQRLNEARAELDQGQQRIDEGGNQLENARLQASSGEAALAEGKQQLESARTAAKQSLAAAESELANAKKQIDDGRSELECLKKPETYTLDRSTNVGYVCFDNDASIVQGVSNVFPVFFFLVAALVCMTTMTRMVDEQRTQIGTMKALGYGGAAVARKYMIYSGSAALAGTVAGYFTGCTLIPLIIWKVYDIMYGFAPLDFVYSGALFAVSLAVAMLCSVGTSFAACRKTLAEWPASLIRPKSPKSGKRVLLEHITFLWKRMGFFAKVSVRNVFRYKNRMLMMILGVGGCTALLVTGFGINDSISNIVSFQYDEITTYDYSVMFSAPAEGEQRSDFESAVPGADSVMFLYTGNADIFNRKDSKNVKIVAFEDSLDGFVDLHLKGEQVSIPGQGQIVLTEKLADTLGVDVGDTVTLRDDSMKSFEAQVSGICENYVYDYVYITVGTCRENWGIEAQTKTAYVKVSEGTDVHRSTAAAASYDGAVSVTVNDDLRETVSKMMSRLDYIILLVTVCAAALAFIVIYNLTNINITERLREIATIKVLGFHPGEVGRYVFRENLSLTFAGAAVGLLMGVALHAYVMSCINIDMVAFQTRISPLTFVIAFVMTMAFSVIVDIFMYFRLDRIDMAQSLKSIED